MGGFKRVRPGPQDLRKDYDMNCRAYPWLEPTLRARYRQELRELVLRIRAQDAEKAKVNLPALHEAWEDATNLVGDIGDAIPALPMSPNALAAKVMVVATSDMDIRDPFSCNDVAMCVLEDLRPNLSGLVAAYAERLLTTDLWTPGKDLFLTIGYLSPAPST